jgi:hypothetical protein
MAFDRTVGQTDVPQRPTPDARRSEVRPSTTAVTGYATVYRLFDIGDEVHLDRVLERLSLGPPDRARPVSSEAQALQILNPPVTCSLGSATLKILGQDTVVELSARVFDFGVVSLRARVDAHRVLTWPEFTRFGRASMPPTRSQSCWKTRLSCSSKQLGNTIDRPRIAEVREDYVVYHVTTASVGDRDRPLRDVVRDTDLVPLLLGESRPLSEEARRELLPHRFSYYADDLAILSWDNALIVDPSGADSDVEYILEFANAQLLELRYYDALLDAELPKLYDRIARARVRRRRIFGAGYAQLLGEMQTLVAEVTELVERAEETR